MRLREPALPVPRIVEEDLALAKCSGNHQGSKALEVAVATDMLPLQSFSFFSGFDLFDNWLRATQSPAAAACGAARVTVTGSASDSAHVQSAPLPVGLLVLGPWPGPKLSLIIPSVRGARHWWFSAPRFGRVGIPA